MLHYSGNLLSWMAEKHPEAIDILKGLVKDQRVEFLSGGFYEPILCALPDEDRIMQVKEMTDYVTGLFGVKPKGMWLAERVWEPALPEYLASAGIEYFPLDDYHFKLSGLDDDELSGYFLTEEKGSSVMIFPGSEKLRYFIPFRGVDEVISYFREVSDKNDAPLLTMADDGEKFGVWPETYEHCYTRGWLERFFTALEENSDWITTTTFSEYRSRFRPKGRVYLPSASYREMGEWVLPPQKGLEYEHALEEMQRLFGDKAKGLLRGGIWRSFLSKYPEANHIHKRMLMISRKAHGALKKSESRNSKSETQSGADICKSILHELWKGQCNDAYWHGIFGGLYLPHLRSSLYRHLIAAESLADDIAGGKAVWKEEGDLDCDGFKDICLGNRELTAFFSEQGGSLRELSLKKMSVNVLDSLTRRPEAYHSKILEATATGETGRTKTIHERLCLKDEGLAGHLTYDNYVRASLLDHFMEEEIDLDSLSKGAYDEKGDFIKGLYEIGLSGTDVSPEVRLTRTGIVSGRSVRVEKAVRFVRSGIAVKYLLKGEFSGIFGIEFNISLLGSPYPLINLKDGDLLMKDKGRHDGVKEFSITDEFLKLRLSFSFNRGISLWHYPVETVSLSEEGVEKLYQGTAFLFMRKFGSDDKDKGMSFNIAFTEAR